MKISNTKLRSLLHNPLLLIDGIHSPNLVTPEHKEFKEKYESALIQASSKDFCPGFKFSHSPKDLGFGGMGNMNIPFFSPLNIKDIKRDFSYYWPRDYHSDKYMKFIGAVNLGIWPIVLSEFTKFDKYVCPYVGCREAGRSRINLKVITNYWLYLFVSHGKYEESYAPNCHVRLVDHTISPHYQEEEYISRKEIYEAMVEWNEDKTIKTEIGYEKGFFTEPKLRFYYDGITVNDDDDDSEKGIFKYDGDYKVFGRFSSQQEPKRELSPNSCLFPHALTPIFSFTDQSHDVTHQFTADSFLFDNISHSRYYCRLDSSCT